MSKPTAFVTGSSQGIGAATARALAGAGYRVILHYAGNRALAEDVAAGIAAAGGEALIVAGDLSDPATPERLVSEVAAMCPDGLQALILNAAVMPPSDIAECTPALFDQIVTVNLRAPFFLLQGFTPVLSDHASVVFVSSLTARRVTGGVAAYATLKSGTETLMRRAAQELAPRWIRVNAVAPGTTANSTIAPFARTQEGFEQLTSIQALKRIAEPEDVAGPIAFLCSETARCITGVVLPVDCGSLL